MELLLHLFKELSAKLLCVVCFTWRGSAGHSLGFLSAAATSPESVPVIFLCAVRTTNPCPVE